MTARTRTSMRLTFDHVSAIAYPQYYRLERPVVHTDNVSEKHWSRVVKVGGDELAAQYEGLLGLIRDGELIRDVSLIVEDDPFARIAELEKQVDQLVYERRLLGYCRRTLDAVADPEERYTSDPVVRDRLVGEAADMAQRIVDEIGHPATDEDPLGPGFRVEIAHLQVLIERVGMLAAWTDATHSAIGGRQIRELMADERDNTTLSAAAARTGHYLGHVCDDCLAVPS